MLWHITPCSVESYLTFAFSACCLLNTDSLRFIFFNLGDRGRLFLRNVDCLLVDYIVYIPELFIIIVMKISDSTF
jgi:hypothetical protein